MRGSFGRIGIGVPYFRPGYEFWRWWSWLLIGGLDAGDVLLNDDAMPGEVPIPVVHNALCRAFLETDLETLCIVEDDHCDDDNQTVRRLRTKAQNLDFDIVCASYTCRRSRPQPVGFHFVDWDEERRAPVRGPLGYLLAFNNDAIAVTGTQEYDGAALGCVLIRRWVLEAMVTGTSQTTWWFQWNDAQSQDVGFYARARAVGARVGVDRDVWIQHVGKYVYTKEDFVSWREHGQREREAHGG